MSHFSRKLFREPFQSFTVKFFLNCKINHGNIFDKNIAKMLDRFDKS